MNRRHRASIVANPVLVGAVTTLIVTVAVFLAYNANQGLPFVPTTQLTVQVENGANLLPGNEVREGGYRIGIVSDMRPIRLPDGSGGAEITLKLDSGAGDIPADSTIDLRPRSVLGLKYVELTRGTSPQILPDGATLPPDQARFPVELDELYSTFDEPTRAASRTNLEGFGDALARRGTGINEAIAGLPPLLEDLEPVARLLADDDTNLRRFFAELGDAARVIAPVADTYARSFGAGADVFEAWSRDEEALRETITRSVPTLETGIASLRAQRPFLRDFAALSGSLEDVATRLPRNLPRIIPALETGTRVQRRVPQLNRDLGDVLTDLRELTVDPVTTVSLRGLDRTVGILNPTLRFVGPYITVCNAFNYAWTHVSEHLTEPDPTGTSQRTLLNQPPRNADPTSPSIGSIGAPRPSNGEPVLSGSPVNLHTNAYGAAITDDGQADCEAGQRGYPQRIAKFADPSLNIVVDPHTPGVQGPTFKGRPRVLPGQTFTRHPQLGPKLPEGLDP